MTTNKWQLYSTDEYGNDNPLCPQGNEILDQVMKVSIENRDPSIIANLMHTAFFRSLGATDSEPRTTYYNRWEQAFGEKWMGEAERAWYNAYQPVILS